MFMTKNFVTFSHNGFRWHCDRPTCSKVGNVFLSFSNLKIKRRSLTWKLINFYLLSKVSQLREWERERERESVRERERECVRECVCERERKSVRECACERKNEKEWERGKFSVAFLGFGPETPITQFFTPWLFSDRGWKGVSLIVFSFSGVSDLRNI